MSEQDSQSFWLKLEQYGPALVGALVFAMLLYCAETVAAGFATNQLKSSGLYSAIFGWSAIQTGFAFGVYGFVVGKSNGFIGALRGTQTLARFEGYIRRANWTGFSLTFATIPLIIAEPAITEPFTYSYILISIWFSFFISSLLAFFRLAYNFGTMASVRDREFHGA